VKIIVNGKEREILAAPLTVAGLLKILNVERPDTVSVQLNGEFVNKEDLDKTLLKDGDEVEFLYFMGGGSGKGFATRILHARPLKEDPHGSLQMPIYDNVAFEFKDAEELEAAFLGRKPAHAYSRISNPTVEYLEIRVKEATGALAVMALSSGMAAISNLVVAIAGSGDNIITTKHLFGNTYSLFEKTLKEWGLQVRYADLARPKEAESLVDPKTKAIFFETITNPQLEIADAKALSRIAKDKGILLVADTTLTPPYLFDSAKFGVDIEVLSSTKYISGGATSVGGLIIDNGTFDWSKNSKLKPDAKKFGPFTLLNRLRREVYRNIGAAMSPQSAFLQSVGLETLCLRVDASCANALRIARFLEGSKKAAAVNYPGLEASPYHELAVKQFNGIYGGILTFDLGSKEECFRFINGLKLIRRATNINDNRTLVLHPASTIFCEYDSRLKKEMGVRETMIRLSIGIENCQDIIEDIKQSLEALR